MNGNTYDVVIIGGGVIGSSIARALSKYECRTVLLEKEEDVCSGTSKANSAIVHAGYDAKTGSLKAKLNVKVRNIGIPDEYVEHGNVEVLRQEVGLTPEVIVKQIITDYAAVIEGVWKKTV